MNSKSKFSIINIDSLGQGVHKESQPITFIPHTLPGEVVEAKIVGKKGKVQFGKLLKVDKKSPKRIEPECSYYEKCGGCSYLHTAYDYEFELKSQSYLQDLRKLHTENINPILIKANQRFDYRNRVQLHYDVHSNKLGQFARKSHDIIETKTCKIAHPEIQKAIHNLFENEHWKHLVKKPKGVIELYYRQGKVSISIDSHYAHDGFTQVNDLMNLKLLELVGSLGSKVNPEFILDLFGGNGNLSNWASCQRLVIDSSPAPENSCDNFNYSQVNLYGNKALETTLKLIPSKVDLLILDPPRSGLKDLPIWINKILPEYVLYVSCFHQTMNRDLQPVLNLYQPIELGLIDLFPSTHHLESFVLLKKT